MTNQSELREMLKKYNWSSDKDYQIACIAFKDITANYTLTSEVEQLKSRIAWLEVEGLGGTVKKLPRFVE